MCLLCVRPPAKCPLFWQVLNYGEGQYYKLHHDWVRAAHLMTALSASHYLLAVHFVG